MSWFTRLFGGAKPSASSRPSIAEQFGDSWGLEEPRYKTMFRNLEDADKEVVFALEEELEGQIKAHKFNLTSSLKQDYSPAAQACIVEMLRSKDYLASFPAGIFTCIKAATKPSAGS